MLKRGPLLLGALLLLVCAATAQAAPAFPVTYSADRRYLVDQNGVPFPILGRTAWFVTSLSVADYHLFIDDTASRGYTAIELHVVNHDPRGNHPPFNGNGDLPFLQKLNGTPWNGSLTGYGDINADAPDFTTPNEAYWSLVDGLLAYAESKGLLVFMFPAYVGYQGGDQGWMQEMVANGVTKMQAYGAWLAARYRNQKNLVWMMGGDMGTAPNTFNASQTTVESALLTGLTSVPGQQSVLFSAEWTSESIGTDQITFGSSMTLNSVYSWTGDVNSHGRRAYGYSPVEPAFLLEEPYDEEGPDGNGANGMFASQPVRRFQWWGWLSTIGGYISGNGYVWPFNASDWRTDLNTQGSRDMARLNAFIGSLAWYHLVPSGLGGMRTLVTAGGSSVSETDYVTAAATPPGTLLVAYLPPAHTGPISVDMGALSGPARARWFDPTSGTYTNIGAGLANTGSRAFTPPGTNSVGEHDWVLVLDTTRPTVTPTVTAAPKPYDGTTSAMLASCTLSGVLGGDVVSCTGTATFTTASVGTGKPVTVSGLTLTGLDAANYTLASTTATTTAAITALTVTPTVTVATKPYDGTPSATLASCTVSGVIGTEIVACTGTAAFATASVGTGKPVAVSGLTLTGLAAANYTLASPTATTTAAITTLTVTPTVTVATKPYDGTPSATLASCTVSGVIGTEIVACTGTAAFATASVGTGKPVAVSGLTLTGLAAANYTLASPTATTTAAITALTVTPTVTVATKPYDGTPSAALASCTVSDVIGTEVVACTGSATFTTASVGTGKPVTVNGLTLTGLAAANYTLASTTATTTAAITALTVTPTVTVATKPYDGTPSAALASCTVSGVVGTEVVACTGTATFTTASVGIGKPVAVSGLTLTGLAAANYTLASTTATTTAAITTLTVTPTVTVATKPYDGTPSATLASCTVRGVIGTEVVACTGSATFSTASVGTGKPVAVSGLTLTGLDAANYTLASTTATTTAAITTLTVTPTVTVATKPYDGTPSATLASCSLSGVIGTEAVACTGTAAFATASVGTGKPVTVSGLTLTGPDAANYALTTTAATATAAITALTVTPTVTVASKPYDGTPSATLTSCTVSGVVGTEVVACTGTVAFATASVGTGKPVTVSGLTLTGSDAGNYALTTTAATATAAITALTVTPTVTVATKPYDGTPSATLASCSLSGVIGTEAVACTGTVAFATASVGTGKPVTVSGLTLTGLDAGNYALTTTAATATAAITALTVTPTVTVASKPYDGTPSATLASCTVSGVIGTEVVACTGTAAFATASAGAGKLVTVSGLTLTGLDAANYTLPSTTATTTAAITDANQAPMLIAAGHLSTTTEMSVSLQLAASAPDENVVTYGATGLPPGLSVDPNTGLISGTPSSPGVYPVTAIASDPSLSNSQSFVWTVVARPVGRVKFIQANSSGLQAPQAAVTVPYPASQSAGHMNVVIVGWRDSTAQVQAVTDTSGNHYELAVGPTVNTGVGTQAIYYAANIAAATAGGNAVTVTFTAPPTLPDIRVAAYAGIDPVNPVDVTSAAQETGATLDSGVTSTTFADDLLIGASLVAGPATMAPGDGYTSRVLSSSGNILEDRIVTTIGSYRATAEGPPASAWIMQMVAFRGPNPLPTLMDPGPQISDENTSISLRLLASDPDDEPLTYAVTTLPPSSLTVDPTTGIITGGFSFTSAGTYMVTASVSDGANAGSQSFTWTVRDVNQAPVVTAIAPQTNSQNDSVSVPASATDPDGGAVMYSAAGLPDGLTIAATSGVISGTLSYASAGAYPVTVTATDTALAIGSTSFTWTVTDANQATDQAAPAFPVRYSADSRYLMDQNGVPFPILGRTAWFVTSLSVADYHLFIDDTASRGYTAIELHVVNHDPRGNHPPFNGNGDLPFLQKLNGTPWNGSLTGYGDINADAPDFTTPNEAYWSLVDGLLAYAESKGLLVFMFPAYVGYQGGDQGWMQEMVANGVTKMQAYGAWLATRYRNQKNLVWMMGGDMGTAPNTFNASQTNVESALLTGLTSVPGQQSVLFSAEWTSESIGTDQITFGSSMTLNSVYSWSGDVNSHGRRAYGYSPVEPAFLLEEPYDEEGPDGNGANGVFASQPVRRFQWWGWLSTIGGYISGNGYVWPFNASDWRTHLNTQGSRDMARLNAFIGSLAWYHLVPSGLGGMRTLVTAGGSSVSETDYVTAAATPPGTLLVAYLPPAHTGPISVDMGALSGPARARWFDPTSGTYTNIGAGLANTGSRAFTTPGTNSVGEGDWVLVLDTTSGNQAPLVTAIAPQTHDEGDTVSVTASATDPDGGTLTFSATGLPDGVTITAAGVISGTLSYTSAGTHAVTVTATDLAGATGSTSFTWTVRDTNRPPVLTAIANRSDAENTAIALALVASDPDSDSLTYSATGLPAGVSMDTATGAITGTLSYASAGSHAVTVTVSDGTLPTSQTFTWTVTNTNRAPVLTAIANQTHAEHDSVSVTTAATDPDGDSLTYSATGVPAGVSMDSATGAITGTLTYASAGTHAVTVTVSDGTLTATQSFTWTVSNTNQPPVLTAIANRSDAENAAIALALTASDPDGDSLTYSAAGLPPGVSMVQATGAIAGTLSYTSAGTHPVTVTVSDGTLTANQAFTWTVSNTNQAPVLTAIANRSDAENTAIVLALVASDPDSDSLTYSATGLPAGVSIDTATGAITGTLGYASAGTHAVTVSATDSGLAVGSQAFIWTVTDVNRAPVLTAIADRTDAENTTVTLALVASDPDGTALMYSATGLPAGLTINPTDGVISGTLAYTSTGTYTVTATVSDGAEAPTTTFTWTVTDVNRAPAMTAVGYLATPIDTSASLQLAASDPDGDPVTYSVSGLPPGLSVDAGTGLISGAPSSAGVYTVTAIATDAVLSHNQSFVWTVVSKPVGRVTFIQANSSAPQTSQAAVTVRYPVSQAAGHLNVVVVGWKDSTAQVQAVTDSTGNLYQLAVGPTVDVSVGTQAIYYSANIAAATAGGNAVTVTFSAPPTLPDIRVAAYAGIDPVNALDATAAAQGTGSALDSSVSVTTFADDLLVGASLVVGPATTGPGAGYTVRVVSSSGNILEDRVVNTVGTYTALAEGPAGSAWIMQMVAFRNPNPAPGWLTNPENQVSAENTTVALALTASDPDDEPLTYGATGLPLGITINPATGVISGTLGFVSAGIYPVIATVSDGDTTISAPFTWVVTNVNRPPVLTAVVNQTSVENATVALPLVASDPDLDGPALVYAVTGLPASLSTNPTTGVIAGTLTYTSAGAYTVIATVSDGAASATTTFTWTVTNVNRAPILAAVATQTNAERATIALALVASDPDGDGLTFTATGLPPGVAIDAATGAMTGTLSAVSAGTHAVTATVSDGSLTTRQSFTWTVTNRATRADFDGDGKTDVAVYRPATGEWFIRRSSTATLLTTSWGMSGDVPVPGDYDGDGLSDVAVYRPATGAWYVRRSSTSTLLTVTWGMSGDIAVPGDYDGDGSTDIAVYRPATGTWYLLRSSTATQQTAAWGGASDVPVPGDYDGDGKTDIGVYRPATGEWSILQSSTSTLLVVAWGGAGDAPVPADYDGDGKTDIGVYRPATGMWYLNRSSTSGTTSGSYQWGTGGDVPVPGDYDGDGKTDIAVYRPSTGTWFVLKSSTNASMGDTQWGGPVDIPAFRAW